MKRMIYSSKYYRVRKYEGDNTFDYGVLSGEEARDAIGTATYNEELDMWFTERATKGYSLDEVSI